MITWTYIFIPCKYQDHRTNIHWVMTSNPKRFDEKFKRQRKFLCKFWLCFLLSFTAKQPKNGYENGYESGYENGHENAHENGREKNKFLKVYFVTSFCLFYIKNSVDILLDFLELPATYRPNFEHVPAKINRKSKYWKFKKVEDNWLLHSEFNASIYRILL